MTITRRTALKGIGGLAASLLLPSWQLLRPEAPIDLSAFCDPDSVSFSSGRYDLTKPFVQEAGEEFYRYATDARICVRVDSAPEDRDDKPEIRLPKAENLPWVHDELGGWKPWPKSSPVLAADTRCPTCEGHGAIGFGARECEACEGEGQQDWAFDNYPPEPPRQCLKCDGIGWLGMRCPMCQGKRYGTFPGIVFLGHMPMDAIYSAKILKHLSDVEYSVWQWDGLSKHYGVCDTAMIRFDGGIGIAMGLTTESTERRIRDAS